MHRNPKICIARHHGWNPRGRLGDEPRGGDEGAMSVAEGEEGVRADDDYAKGEIDNELGEGGGRHTAIARKPKRLSTAHAAVYGAESVTDLLSALYELSFVSTVVVVL